MTKKRTGFEVVDTFTTDEQDMVRTLIEDGKRNAAAISAVMALSGYLTKRIGISMTAEEEVELQMRLYQIAGWRILNADMK